MHPLDRTFRRILPAGALAVLATALAVGWFAQPDRYARGFAPARLPPGVPGHQRLPAGGDGGGGAGLS